MKFGILDTGIWHESQTIKDLYEATLRRAELAEECNFDELWLGEHHFSRHGTFPNTLTLAANIAARTERLRIGTAVVVLPLHHPVRVAEEAAMVDVLSGGRLDLGIGAGYQRPEFNGLGVDINESRARFAESLDILTAAWRQDPLAYEGRFHSWNASDDVQVGPKPLQQPHPPIYVAVSTSPETIEMAAGRNLQILVGGPSDIIGLAPQVIRRWREAMRENGHDPSEKAIPCGKGIYVAPTDEEAAADIAAIDRSWHTQLLRQIGSPISPSGEIPPGYESWAMRAEEREKRLAANSAGTEALVGSPETVANRIRDLESMGIESIFGLIGLPGMPEAKKRRAIELFGREVIPQFKADRHVGEAVLRGA